MRVEIEFYAVKTGAEDSKRIVFCLVGCMGFHKANAFVERVQACRNVSLLLHPLVVGAVVFADLTQVAGAVRWNDEDLLTDFVTRQEG